MRINLNTIKPKICGMSDKYSANLYKHIKKNPHARVYAPATLEYSKDSFKKVDVWLGTFHSQGISGISGDSLMSILRQSGNGSYFLPAKREDYLDITEDFFTDYEEIGRCLFDPSHTSWLRYDEGRFTNSESARTCNWCGRSQLKTTTTVCRTVELWEDVK